MNTPHPASTDSDTDVHATAMRRVNRLLGHYGASHTQPANELIHYLAIPAIMLSLSGLIYAVHPWLAYAFIAASLVYYAQLSTVFLLAMVAITLGMLAIVRWMDHAGFLVTGCVTIFVVAWIFQFIGHKLEGKKPSFFEDIQYLWVGPLFVLSKLFLKIGVRW